MNLLALDSSSKAASVALLRDGRLAGEFYLDCGLTHSTTLMPMVESLCALSGIVPAQLDGVAVTKGPGSFTGVRIGLATAKGLAAALDIPCAGVSTLLALAYNLLGHEGVCCSVLDARCSQVYYALFELHPGGITRLSEDAAAPMDALIRQVEARPGPVTLAGDGAALCLRELSARLPQRGDFRLAPAHLVLQRAGSAGLAALDENRFEDAGALAPCYLRLSQAERERLEKLRAQEIKEPEGPAER